MSTSIAESKEVQPSEDLKFSLLAPFIHHRISATSGESASSQIISTPPSNGRSDDEGQCVYTPFRENPLKMKEHKFVTRSPSNTPQRSDVPDESPVDLLNGSAKVSPGYLYVLPSICTPKRNKRDSPEPQQTSSVGGRMEVGQREVFRRNPSTPNLSETKGYLGISSNATSEPPMEPTVRVSPGSDVLGYQEMLSPSVIPLQPDDQRGTDRRLPIHHRYSDTMIVNGAPGGVYASHLSPFKSGRYSNTRSSMSEARRVMASSFGIREDGTWSARQGDPTQRQVFPSSPESLKLRESGSMGTNFSVSDRGSATGFRYGREPKLFSSHLFSPTSNSAGEGTSCSSDAKGRSKQMSSEGDLVIRLSPGFHDSEKDTANSLLAPCRNSFDDGSEPNVGVTPHIISRASGVLFQNPALRSPFRKNFASPQVAITSRRPVVDSNFFTRFQRDVPNQTRMVNGAIPHASGGLLVLSGTPKVITSQTNSSPIASLMRDDSVALISSLSSTVKEYTFVRSAFNGYPRAKSLSSYYIQSNCIPSMVNAVRLSSSFGSRTQISAMAGAEIPQITEDDSATGADSSVTPPRKDNSECTAEWAQSGLAGGYRDVPPSSLLSKAPHGLYAITSEEGGPIHTYHEEKPLCNSGNNSTSNSSSDTALDCYTGAETVQPLNPISSSPVFHRSNVVSPFQNSSMLSSTCAEGTELAGPTASVPEPSAKEKMASCPTNFWTPSSTTGTAPPTPEGAKQGDVPTAPVAPLIASPDPLPAAPTPSSSLPSETVTSPNVSGCPTAVGGHHLALKCGRCFLKQTGTKREEKFYEAIQPYQQYLVNMALQQQRSLAAGGHEKKNDVPTKERVLPEKESLCLPTIIESEDPVSSNLLSDSAEADAEVFFYATNSATQWWKQRDVSYADLPPPPALSVSDKLKNKVLGRNPPDPNFALNGDFTRVYNGAAPLKERLVPAHRTSVESSHHSSPIWGNMTPDIPASPNDLGSPGDKITTAAPTPLVSGSHQGFSSWSSHQESSLSQDHCSMDDPEHARNRCEALRLIASFIPLYKGKAAVSVVSEPHSFPDLESSWFVYQKEKVPDVVPSHVEGSDELHSSKYVILSPGKWKEVRTALSALPAPPKEVPPPTVSSPLRPVAHLTYIEVIVLEDVCHDFAFPCIMDVKMGHRQYGIAPSEHKKQSKMLKAKLSASAEHGVRLAGYRSYNLKNRSYVSKGKIECRYFSLEKIKEEVDIFLGHNNALKGLFRDYVKQLRTAFQQQRAFRFFTSSLLLVYDAANPLVTARVVMVDFAFTYERWELINKNDEDAGLELDQGYLKALDSLYVLLS